MPRRRATTRRKSDLRVIEGLRASIAAGAPWRPSKADGNDFGWSDLRALLHGAFYFPEFCREDDEESVRALWEPLRADFLSGHIKREPGTRPWAWWAFDAPESRKIVGALDVHGRPVAREPQEDYLRRHDLLTVTEEKLLDEFNLVCVRLAGMCEDCLSDVSRKAASLDFNLGRAMNGDFQFYIPEELLFRCTHLPGRDTHPDGTVFHREYVP